MCSGFPVCPNTPVSVFFPHFSLHSHCFAEKNQSVINDLEMVEFAVVTSKKDCRTERLESKRAVHKNCWRRYSLTQELQQLIDQLSIKSVANYFENIFKKKKVKFL